MVVDIETTGLDPAGGHVAIEVATVAITPGAPHETWASLIAPGRPIPAEAAAVHGISDAMVVDAPDPARVAAELRRRCAGRLLVFHHAAFDLPFIAALLRAGGQPPLFNPILDTLGLARGLPDPQGHSLEALASRLGLPHEVRHRALGDALATARLLGALAPRWQATRGVTSLLELAAASQDAMRQARATPRVPAPPAPLPLFEGLEPAPGVPPPR